MGSIRMGLRTSLRKMEGTKLIIVETLDQLKQLASEEPFDCRILLNHGVCSSKLIQYEPEGNIWSIFHMIDDTETFYNGDDELKNNYPFLLEAIEHHALVSGYPNS